ncbi:MAG: hypothetical protein ACLTDR_15215 [Adlercreutzia equolifaciens]
MIVYGLSQMNLIGGSLKIYANGVHAGTVKKHGVLEFSIREFHHHCKMRQNPPLQNVGSASAAARLPYCVAGNRTSIRETARMDGDASCDVEVLGDRRPSGQRGLPP